MQSATRELACGFYIRFNAGPLHAHVEADSLKPEMRGTKTAELPYLQRLRV